MPSIFDFEPRSDFYAVMGNPIKHSKSPQIHTAFAKQTKEPVKYDPIHVELGGFVQSVGNFVANGGKGLNITVPYKQEAWALVDKRSEAAQIAGAVNTIIVQEDGSLLGENTDGTGLVRDITINHQQNLENKHILIMGAGGAVRGVVMPLLATKPASITIVNRHSDKAITLEKLFQDKGNVKGCGYSELGQQKFDVIINGTSASLGGELPPLPKGITTKNTFCYDMMYDAKATVFMQWAQAQGCSIAVDGLGMLIEQAAESFFLWRGIRPETAGVLKTIRDELNN